MKVIRISAIWCSSCLVMKSRFNEVADKLGIEVIDLDYDLDYERVNDYNIGEILPVYIKGDKRLIGEHSKEEIERFLRD